MLYHYGKEASMIFFDDHRITQLQEKGRVNHIFLVDKK